MNFKNINDLSDDIQSWLGSLPSGIQCIVGIPRSGMLVGNIIALKLNLPFTDVDGFISGHIMGAGRRLRMDGRSKFFNDRRKVLVVDDCISSGKSMIEAQERIKRANLQHEVVYGCVYKNPGKVGVECLYHSMVPKPRVFEWNVLSVKGIGNYCFDLDSVFCKRRSCVNRQEEARTGLEFLNVDPLFIPSYRIGCIVTARQEQHRSEVERWLDDHGIEFGTLIMCESQSGTGQNQSKNEIAYKADAYVRSGAKLFIGGELAQAQMIADASGGYVYSTNGRVVVGPGGCTTGAKSARVRAMKAIRSCGMGLKWLRQK